MLVAACLLAALVVPTASAQPGTMSWYRWHGSSEQLRAGADAIVGLAAMRELASLKTAYGIHVVRTFPSLRAAEIRTTTMLVTRAHGDPRIRYISMLDAAQTLPSLAGGSPLVTTIDTATGLPYEWQLAASDLDEATAARSGPAPVVGIIDSGVADVPDLHGKIDARWSVSAAGELRRDAAGDDVVGHGTAVASLIAANGYGMLGFCGACHVVSIRALSLTDVAVAMALMKLDALGIRIVNMSFGSPAPLRPLVLDALHKAEADGMLLIAAAGNASGPVAHPAADLQPALGGPSEGLAVGASDADGKLAFFSNSGANLSLVAPGSYRGPCSGVLVAAPINADFVASCYPSWRSDDGGSYAYVSGTSFAAPEVAGVAALVWAARPELRNLEVAEILEESAGRAWTPTLGYGALDARAALARASGRT